MRSLIAVLAVAMGAGVAIAAPPGEAEKRAVSSAGLKAAAHAYLGSQGKEAPGTGFFASARDHCAKAKDALARFDPDNLLNAQIEQCFGTVAAFEGNWAAACPHFKRAQGLLQQVGAAGTETERLLIASVRRSNEDMMKRGSC